MRPLPRPLPAAFLLTSFLIALLPPSVRTQERNIGVGSSQAGAGGYHALIIGNNEYRSLPRLKTAEADARQVATLLRESYGFETTLLLNATRAQIVSSLAAHRRRLGAEARLLIYYAGHGYNDREQDKAYWLPVDAERDDPANWIIADEITSAIRAIPARHVLVVSDSCYSGTLTRGLGESLPPAAERERFIEKMVAGRSRMLMASGGNEPVADGGGGGNSVFAAALLRGLREMDKGKFTAAELFRNYVVEPVAGRAEQTPEYNPIRNSGHESGDFVFVKVKAKGANVEMAVKAPLPAAVDPAHQELAFWNSIQNSNDAEDFKDYLGRYPTGLYAGIARRRLAALSNTKKPAPTPASPTVATDAPADDAAAASSTANAAGSRPAERPSPATDPPAVPGKSATGPLDQTRIIGMLAAKEAATQRALNRYSYQREAIIQTIGATGAVTGEYNRVSQFTFDASNNRLEKILRFPKPTLTEIEITPADLDGMCGVGPFALETINVSRYDFTYAGKEKIDELDLYVFDVSPKSLPDPKRSKERYFQGRIWVEDQGLQIVRAKGKGVPEGDERFPTCDTYRENLDGEHWFPTYVYADEQLVFRNGQSIHIRLKIRFTNFSAARND